MPEPTSETGVILAAADSLLCSSAHVIEVRGITLIGVALTNLDDHWPGQLILPFDKARDLDATLDQVRGRFGASAIVRGALVQRDCRPWVPPLPE